MKAMVLKEIKTPLKFMEVPRPIPKEDEVLVKVAACGVCRTDLHIVDGELREPKLPLILGHQIVGQVEQMGSKVRNLQIGQQIGIPWTNKTCGSCLYCQEGRENLCDNPLFTGYNINGGFAEYSTSNYQFCFPFPKEYSPLQGAPLLCGGLIGFRSYRMLPKGVENLGLYGFGSAAHILLQVANYFKQKVYAFTRPDDHSAQKLAINLGAYWSGSIDEKISCELDSAIIFAPAGELVPCALKTVKKGGSVILGGIYMSDIPTFPYEILWGERILRSVANLTRSDGLDFFKLLEKIPIKTKITSYSLKEVNTALDNLRSGKIDGSIVIKL